jgi:hypothetical protein
MSLPAGGWKIVRSEPTATVTFAVVMDGDRGDRLQQRRHRVPLDVVAHWVLEDLAQRVPVVVVEVW